MKKESNFSGTSQAPLYSPISSSDQVDLDEEKNDQMQKFLKNDSNDEGEEADDENTMYSSGVSSRFQNNFRDKKSSRFKQKKLSHHPTPPAHKLPYPNRFCFYYYNSKIRVNISGKIFEIYEYILDNYPLSLLGSKEQRVKYYDRLRDEFFFDRNREAFEGILQFYQTNGTFEIPFFVPVDVFYEELKYFGLHNYLNCESRCDDNLLILALNGQLDDIKKSLKDKSLSQERINELRIKKRELKVKFKNLNFFFEDDDEEEAILEDEQKAPKNKYQKLLWLLLERPNSSLLGRILAFFCLVTVILSVAIMCLETVVDSNNIKSKNQYKSDYDDISSIYSDKSDSLMPKRKTEFFILELICNSVFTVEIILRFIASPNKLKFIRNFSNMIDIVSILPFWTTIIINNNYLAFSSSKTSSNTNQTNKKRQNHQYALSVLRILRLTRVLRVLKLSRHIRVLNIMGKILYECVYEIILLLTFLAINIVIFSSLMYYIELHALGEMSPFISIPHSFWWAIISFTTIGYGDLIPQSAIGKLFGSFFILCGILIALLPVPILSCKFERIYKEFSHESRINKKKNQQE